MSGSVVIREEEGGCDETFAIEVNLQTKVTTWKLEPVETVERELALDETKPVTTLMGRNVCLDCNGTGGVKP